MDVVSTVTLSVDAPPAAVLRDITFYGEHRIGEVPHGEGELWSAFGKAIDVLLAEVAGTRHDVGVHFGCEVVAVLAAAERSRETGAKVDKHGPPDPSSLGHEIEDLIHTALSLARFYGVERVVDAAIDYTHANLTASGDMLSGNAATPVDQAWKATVE
jgi:hypothetical protein